MADTRVHMRPQGFKVRLEMPSAAHPAVIHENLDSVGTLISGGVSPVLNSLSGYFQSHLKRKNEPKYV